MQKGKATPSPPAMVLQRGPPQQNTRGPPSSQQRPEDFNPRQPQSFQIPGQIQPSMVMGGIPGQMQGPQGQQPRMPNQQSFYHQRPMRIPRHQGPNTPPMYSSPPGVVQMIPQGGTPFLSTGQGPPQFISPHVEYAQIPMGGPPQMQYRPQQPMQGQFTPVSGPSQPPGPYGYPPTTVYPMGQPPAPVYIVRAPAPTMGAMPQYTPPQNFEPRARERKIIQIKDPNSNKDVTHL